MTDDHFSMWYFPRYALLSLHTRSITDILNRWFIPGNIWTAAPDPRGWWDPFVTYTGCDFKSHFKDLRLVLNTDFCGGVSLL